MSKSKVKSAAKAVRKSMQDKPAAPKTEVVESAAPVAEPIVATVDATAAPVEAPASKAKKSKPAVITVNGIKRPAAETLCGRVFQILDDLRTAGVDATPKNAAAAFDGVAISPATIRTQYARWRKFNNIAPKSATPPVVSEELQQSA